LKKAKLWESVEEAKTATRKQKNQLKAKASSFSVDYPHRYFNWGGEKKPIARGRVRKNYQVG